MPNYPLKFSAKEVELTVLHHPSAGLWILELKNGEDSRLTGDMCQKGISPALDVVESDWRAAWRLAQKSKDKVKGAGSGALVIVGNMSQQKFFSNGFDYQQVITTPGLGFIMNNFVPIMKRLLTFPIPTISAINGHCFAAGFMMSLCCDYRVMTNGRAWACMNEVHFGAPFPHSFAAVVQGKARNPTLVRSIALEGHKFTATELVEAGLVDKLAEGGTDGVVRAATELAQTVGLNATTGVYGLIKKELYVDVLKKLDEDTRQVMPFEEDGIALAKL